MDHVRDGKIMHYTYLLESSINGKWYIGYTKDLRKRFNEHNKGKNGWTKTGVPWKLIYYESCFNEEDARSREKYFKTGMGRRYLKNRLKRFLSLT